MSKDHSFSALFLFLLFTAVFLMHERFSYDPQYFPYYIHEKTTKIRHQYYLIALAFFITLQTERDYGLWTMVDGQKSNA